MHPRIVDVERPAQQDGTDFIAMNVSFRHDRAMAGYAPAGIDSLLIVIRNFRLIPVNTKLLSRVSAPRRRVSGQMEQAPAGIIILW